jgi:hypothetical protein
LGRGAGFSWWQGIRVGEGQGSRGGRALGFGGEGQGSPGGRALGFGGEGQGSHGGRASGFGGRGRVLVVAGH